MRTMIPLSARSVRQLGWTSTMAALFALCCLLGLVSSPLLVSVSAQTLVIPFTFNASVTYMNPFRGLVPTAGVNASNFPCSMEFVQLPLSAVLPNSTRAPVWTQLDAMLAAVATRRHQVILQLYLDLPKPGQASSGVPIDLTLGQGAVTFTPYTVTASGAIGSSPSYDTERLVAALESFIALFGARYDRDTRMAFFMVGMFGIGGNWVSASHGQSSTAEQQRTTRAAGALFWWWTTNVLPFESFGLLSLFLCCVRACVCSIWTARVPLRRCPAVRLSCAC